MKPNALVLVVAVIAVHSRAFADSLAPNRTTLITVLQSICPLADICKENRSTPAPSVSIDSGMDSCCADCSCEPDCMKNNDCCFPESSTDIPLAEKTTLECKDLTTRYLGEYERTRYISYLMIVSVDEGTNDKNYSRCGDIRVAPWGSLYPVFSPKRKQLYKNGACAVNDNVDDGQTFDAILVCPQRVERMVLDASVSVHVLATGFVPDYCYVDFIYNGSPNDLKNLKCYIDPINSCTALDFRVPGSVDLSSDEIADACTSGLLSPFRNSKLYANVFCHICNENRFGVSRGCPKQYDGSYRTPGSSGMATLIDGRYVKNKVHTHSNEGLVTPKACLDQKSNDCRDVLCPSGKMRDQYGECIFPNKLWYGLHYLVYLTLTADTNFDVEEIFDGRSLVTSLPQIISPWLPKWKIERFLFDDTSIQHSSRHLYVLLSNEQTITNPNVFMGKINTMINKQWLFSKHNKSITFKSSFRDDHLLLGQTSELVKGSFNEIINRPKLSVIYDALFLRKSFHVITKLYLCDQIELDQSEFFLSTDNYVVFNNITKTVLYTGEFTPILKTDRTDRIRVCMDDSGFYRKPIETSRGVNICTDVYIVAAVIVVHLLRK